MPPAFEATAAFAPAYRGAAGAAPSWLQRVLHPFGAIPAGSRDRSTGLYTRDAFFAAADDAMRAGTSGKPVSVAVFEVEDLREVCDIYGRAVARKVAAKFVRRLRRIAGWRALAGRTGPTQFTVVVVGANQQKTLQAVQRVLGKPARVEYDAGESEIVLVPELLVDTAEAGAESVRPLYREMTRDLARFRKQERRRLDFLASERERHSRPMPLSPLQR